MCRLSSPMNVTNDRLGERVIVPMTVYLLWANYESNKLFFAQNVIKSKDKPGSVKSVG